MARKNGPPTNSPRTCTILGCRFYTEGSARPLMICQPISILIFLSLLLSPNLHPRVRSNQMPNLYRAKMMASRAFWPRKKLRQPLPLPKRPSQHLKNQGISGLPGSNVETSEARITFLNVIGWVRSLERGWKGKRIYIRGNQPSWVANLFLRCFLGTCTKYLVSIFTGLA